MELLVKRVSSLIVLTLFFFSVSADNTIFEIVNRVKKRNPSDCSLASYHRSSDHYRVICIGKSLNRYLYRIPLTVDSNSSLLIDEDHYLNIDNTNLAIASSKGFVLGFVVDVLGDSCMVVDAASISKPGFTSL